MEMIWKMVSCTFLRRCKCYATVWFIKQQLKMNEPQIARPTPTPKLITEDLIAQYFSKRSRVKSITQSTHKIQTMIQKGEIQVKTQTPFPLRQNKSLKLSPQIINEKKRTIRLKTQPSPKSRQPNKLNQLSAKNKRFLESLLLKYTNFTSSMEKLAVQPDEAITRQTFTRICYYQELLQKSSNRLPISPRQQQLLDETPFNLSLSLEMSNDLDQLKRYARQFNCSLHRRNKYYECLQEIRRKISSISSDYPPKLEKLGKGQKRDESKPRYRQSNNSRVKQVEISRHKTKGNEYLNYSRQVAVESKRIYERERGNVKFLKEVVHHWWGTSIRQDTSHTTIA